jgi:predicted  nucleic acid-binding Zn-ribbon protein
MWRGLAWRVAKIEGILEQMDKRLNHLESEIRDLRVEIRDLRAYVESEIKGLRGEIGDLRRDLNNRFLRILGVQITMWVTIIIALIFR